MNPVLLNFSLLPTVHVESTHKVHLAAGDQFTGAPGMPTVTDLRALRGHRVIAILDGDNLTISAKNLNLRVRFAVLLSKLRQQARQVFPVAVITSNPGDKRLANGMEAAGWRVVSIQRETIVADGRVQKIANADADLCFELGVMSSVAECTAVLIGTGDGNLAISCAAGLKRLFKNKSVAIHALSVAGSTSVRLRKRVDLFSSSILLGMDLLARGADGPHAATSGTGVEQ